MSDPEARTEQDTAEALDAREPTGAAIEPRPEDVDSQPETAEPQVAETRAEPRTEEAAPEPEGSEPQPAPAETQPEAADPESEPAEPAADEQPDASGEQDEVEASSAPDLTADEALDAALEALLLVVDIPAGEELLADTLEQPVARVRTALHRLSAGYAEADRGLDLRRVGDGWRFYTREKYAPYVERYLLDGQRTKLTRAALETLAVIAYRQPVTRAKVGAVRGVNVDGVVRTLVGRGLIEEAGTDPETGGTLYCTTELFLERLGLSSLKDLPPLAPLLPEVDSIDDV